MSEARAAPSAPPRASGELLTTPWLARRLAAAPVPPLAAGVGLSLLLLLVLVAAELAVGDLGRVLRGEAPAWKVEEYRFSVVLALLAGYLPAATAYLWIGARRTREALRSVLTLPAAAVDALVASAGRDTRRSLLRAGLLGAAFALLVPILVDETLAAYSLRNVNTSAAGHRVLLLVIGWQLGRFVHLVLADARRLSELGREHTRVDLFDRTPFAPFVRQGLRNAALSMGMLAILALVLVDLAARPGLPWVLAGGLLASALLAASGLMLPVRGVHQALRRARALERERCLAAIRRRRDALRDGRAAGPAEGGRLDELAAWLQLVEAAREWPFDASTLVRMGLYVGLPLGSWLGGALVERILDALLAG